MSRLSIRLPLTVAWASFVLFALPSFADSQVRIVRLSDVQGDVRIDRNAGQGSEKAFANLPLTQGVKIKTKADGRAEVEFEDGSTLRIAPSTSLEFSQLSLRDSGGKVSTVDVKEGTAYVKFAGAKDDEFTLNFGREKLTLTRPAHLRVEMGDTDATVAVFKGDVQIVAPSGTVEVSKNRTVNFDFTDQDRYTLAKDLEPDPYDAWDKEQDQYHQRYTANNSQTYSPYAYGTSDLNYYGSFFNAPGYGMMWQPYFIGAGWDPFMNGAWVFSPGFGYGWVSGYPWGWTPFHYGTWAYLPSYGWAWQPGGSWAGLNTIPRVSNPPANFLPPQPPATGGSRLVVVNRGPMPTLMGSSSNRVQIPNNSAGLGIPRGSIRSLSSISHTVEQKGTASTSLHTAPVGYSAWSGGYTSSGSRMGSSAHASSPHMSSAGSVSAGHASSHAGGGGHPK